jgi:hypothetical protein
MKKRRNRKRFASQSGQPRTLKIRTAVGSAIGAGTARSVGAMIKDDVELFFSPLKAVAGEFRKQLRRGDV